MAFSSPYREAQLQQFIRKLGFTAQPKIDWLLLDQALTHPSADPARNYERLEFLGDAALKLTVSRFLYDHLPTATEGEMSVLRDVLVSDRMLAQIGGRYGLDRYLLLGNAILGDVSGRDSRIAQALEAVLGVLYLAEPKLSLISIWLDPHLQKMVSVIQNDPALMNYKGALQELTQRDFQVLPDYHITEVFHSATQAERFIAEVWIAGQCRGRGTGSSKKMAEQAAAQEAFLALHRQSL
ncbi:MULTISPECIES: ribonuclease III [unclassified Leptolyngbya]|uniref:ribonuclease III n=1 Tax=unclassified Leptolyngbya TaxID=2650499 RepID=UPI0016859B55|nr:MULTISPECIES: ribonuclease III [unclassified Leptolyngbya]MBD1910621.1 ribonuclease III [Leptolyngbya sp. FACHB-8]MBD2154561.1 ribonuclease III [Leptolyngbya sp. FACHB-16]